MTQITAYKNPMHDRTGWWYAAAYVLIAMAAGTVILASILFVVVFPNRAAFTLISGLGVLELVLGMVAVAIAAALESARRRRELPFRAAWLEKTYPGVFDELQIRILTQGGTVHVNDNGTTRDAAKVTYNEALRGQVVEFTTVSTPRLQPTAV